MTGTPSEDENIESQVNQMMQTFNEKDEFMDALCYVNNDELMESEVIKSKMMGQPKEFLGSKIFVHENSRLQLPFLKA